MDFILCFQIIFVSSSPLFISLSFCHFRACILSLLVEMKINSFSFTCRRKCSRRIRLMSPRFVQAWRNSANQMNTVSDEVACSRKSAEICTWGCEKLLPENVLVQLPWLRSVIFQSISLSVRCELALSSAPLFSTLNPKFWNSGQVTPQTSGQSASNSTNFPTTMKWIKDS